MNLASIFEHRSEPGPQLGNPRLNHVLHQFDVDAEEVESTDPACRPSRATNGWMRRPEVLGIFLAASPMISGSARMRDAAFRLPQSRRATARRSARSGAGFDDDVSHVVTRLEEHPELPPESAGR
jgi:hypothetical protein